ncbi:MCE family protein [Actinoplanes sp. NBRC 103695]|uniref:MCE family protein n=1 Tax=Actinoplanes sp. NBRC 103695 TaxID=3032202 RepID=UPI0024A4619A|nr:MCE family protein [Actinoplanes sp. NBRC 103695]GLY97859.1 ABC transporter substrate-binding protein [Actinoplanes sp. NBRC 103695]
MRLRLLGVGFIVVLLAATTLSVLVYRKAFTPVVTVTLKADHTGLQLNPGADVKVRDVIVGEVREITADGGNATLRLALQPDSTRWVPANVTARLLPKTLFGERYVSLEMPATSQNPIATGAVIGQDRSSSALELERVLDDVLPLLRTINPAQLATTLGVLAGALRGRGDQLGANLKRLDDYLIRFNPHVPTLRTDLARLADTLEAYDGAADDLLTLLRNATVTLTTVSDQRAQLAALLADTADAAQYATGFLDRHGDRIIQVGKVSEPVLELLATYSPEYPCVLAGLVRLQPRVEEVFSGGRMHITLEATRDGGKYVKGRDDPKYDASGGPDCNGLPRPKVPFGPPDIDDGSSHDGGIVPAAMGYAGTEEERGVIDVLAGAATGTAPDQVPDSASLLWGPVLRGTVVNEG